MDLGGTADNFFNFNFPALLWQMGWCDPQRRETFSTLCRLLHSVMCPVLSKLGYNVS